LPTQKNKYITHYSGACCQNYVGYSKLSQWKLAVNQALNRFKQYNNYKIHLKNTYVCQGPDYKYVCVCVCLGSGPATAFLKQSGVHMDSKGFIPVNKVHSFCMLLYLLYISYYSTCYNTLSSVTKLLPSCANLPILISTVSVINCCFSAMMTLRIAC